MAVVADALQRIDHRAGIDLARSPLHRQPAVGEIEARIDDPRALLEPVLDLADAGGAADPSTATFIVRERAVLAHKDRKIESAATWSPQRSIRRLRETEFRSNRLVQSSMTRSHCPAARSTSARNDTRRHFTPRQCPVGALVHADGTGDPILQALERTVRSRSRATTSINVVAPPFADVLTRDLPSQSDPAPVRLRSRARKRGLLDRSCRSPHRQTS